MRSQLVGNATHANLNDVQLGAVVDAPPPPALLNDTGGIDMTAVAEESATDEHSDGTAADSRSGARAASF